MSSGGSTRNRKETDYIFAGTLQAGKESGNMALVAYEDAMCKSHSQASLLRNTNNEVVQAYSHSGVEEPGNEASNVQALVQQNSLVSRPVPFQYFSGLCTQTQLWEWGKAREIFNVQ